MRIMVIVASVLAVAIATAWQSLDLSGARSVALGVGLAAGVSGLALLRHSRRRRPSTNPAASMDPFQTLRSGNWDRRHPATGVPSRQVLAVRLQSESRLAPLPASFRRRPAVEKPRWQKGQTHRFRANCGMRARC